MEQADVIILGGGLVGLTLALALDAHGLSSHVIDTADLKNSVAPSFDGRVSAISSSSMKMMDAIGIGARLRPHRSEEHTSELQSLMRISYAVFCSKKQITITRTQT